MRRDNITRVLVYGPHSNNTRLRHEVAAILDKFAQTPTWVVDAVDGTYSGALGSAELAKRKPYWDRAYHHHVDVAKAIVSDQRVVA